MLISYEHRFVFIHVPKAAGTSIERALAPYAHDPMRHRVNRLLDRLGTSVNHLGPGQARRFRKHTIIRTVQRTLPAEVFDGCFKFAFVRNPWDRLVSWYHNIRENSGHHRHRLFQRFDFTAFLEWQMGHTNIPQLQMLTDRTGNVGVDFVGRYEDLRSDFRTVCERLGLRVSLPHLNASRRARDYRDYYAPEQAERIGEVCREEIELFGYDFEDGVRQTAAPAFAAA